MARSIRSDSTKDLTVGSPLKLILGFTIPLLFGFIFQQFYSFVDTAIVGRYLGASMLAAVGSTGSFNFLVLGFCMGFCSGFAIPIAQCFGAKDATLLRKYMYNAIWLSAVLSVLMAVLMGFLCPTILRWMDTPEEIITDSVKYIRIIFFGIPSMVLYNMAGGILRSLGDSKTPVYFLALSSGLNIALDLCFILVFHMGVDGAALATVLAQLLSGIGCVFVMIRNFPILHLQKDERQIRPDLMKKLIFIGFPMGLQFSITAIGGIIMQTAVNSLGVISVAAITAANKISGCLSCVFDSLATAMSTYTSQNVGAGKIDRIGQGLKAASLIGIGWSILAFLIALVFGEPLIGLFVDKTASPEVLSMAVYYIRLVSSTYISLMFVVVLRLTIQGMGFTSVSMLAGLCEMIARIGVAFLLVPVLGFTGACLSNPSAWIAADLFLIPCYFSSIKKIRRQHTPLAD